MVNWHIGCSGFYYKHWKEIFYPEGLPQRKWFEFYCEHFNTLELNVTFYRFPQLVSLKSWHERSPDNFTFSVKAPRIITHFKQFHNVTDLISDFYSIIHEGFGSKLGCVLFQMPPRIAYNEERLCRIIDSLDRSFNNVIEFRHESWWNPNVYKAMSEQEITFCGMSHPKLPRDIIQNTKILYYRFHGIPELYKSPYKLSDLKSFVEAVKNNRKTNRAFIYFNNDIDASAIANAHELQRLVAS
ncbi:MAG TPA: DUF72 domain-containing protein [Sphingobacteriaceae bacterium]